MKTFKDIPYQGGTLHNDLYDWLSDNTWDWDDLSLNGRKMITNMVEALLWVQAKDDIYPQSVSPSCCLPVSTYTCPIDLRMKSKVE